MVETAVKVLGQVVGVVDLPDQMEQEQMEEIVPQVLISLQDQAGMVITDLEDLVVQAATAIKIMTRPLQDHQEIQALNIRLKDLVVEAVEAVQVCI